MKRMKKRRKRKITPIFLPNGDIINANELMLDHDFDNDPVFKAKYEEAMEDLRKNQWPGMFPGRKKTTSK
jgi:hypothetical protein